jgi:hypothetical protein
MERVRQAQSIRQRLQERLPSSGRQQQRAPVWTDLERKIKSILAEWRARFSGDISAARAGLRALLTEPIMFMPCIVRGYDAIQFRGRLGLEGVFGGEVVVTSVASPTGNSVSPIPLLAIVRRPPRWSRA